VVVMPNFSGHTAKSEGVDVPLVLVNQCTRQESNLQPSVPKLFCRTRKPCEYERYDFCDSSSYSSTALLANVSNSLILCK
jgi:hypothetical protein